MTDTPAGPFTSRPIPSMRRQHLLELLQIHGGITCHDVRELFGVSEATARRDIDYLARHRLATRVHGGATQV